MGIKMNSIKLLNSSGKTELGALMTSVEAKNTGRPKMSNRQGLYAKAAKHAYPAIDTICCSS